MARLARGSWALLVLALPIEPLRALALALLLLLLAVRRGINQAHS